MLGTFISLVIVTVMAVSDGQGPAVHQTYINSFITQRPKIINYCSSHEEGKAGKLDNLPKVLCQYDMESNLNSDVSTQSSYSAAMSSCLRKKQLLINTQVQSEIPWRHHLLAGGRASGLELAHNA